MQIVLVHGAGGSGESWQWVAPVLRERGHEVVAVTNPLTGLHDDVAHTTAAVDAIGGPVLLVGHSYGGAVITGVGRHPAVVGLVYVAAFAPDEGESVVTICDSFPPAEVESLGYTREDADGRWVTVPEEGYWRDIAWDLTATQLQTMLANIRQTSVAMFAECSGPPAWRHLPSWYLLAEDDRNLRPEAQAMMAARIDAQTIAIPGSHFVPSAQAPRVIEVIETAATAAGSPGAPARRRS